MRVLLIEDEEALRLSLADDIREAGHEVFDFGLPTRGLEFLLRAGDLDVIVTDWKLPEFDGLELLRRAKQNFPDTLVIVMTAFGTVQTAVDAIKQGAYDYLVKPFETEELLLMLERVTQYRRLIRENRCLLAKLEQQARFHRLLGRSPAMLRLFEQLAVIAPSSSTVLITGETGSGKELVAEAIHTASPRVSGPLVKVSCAALCREVLESELFGHEKGAFTGAIRTQIGRFEMAQGGTIYIDDADDIPLESQVKLLRVLQERALERVGGPVRIALDVRVVASTKRNLRALVEEGKFREDLFYRLNVVPISVPALRQRKEDIPLLALHFLKKYSDGNGWQITPAAIDALMAYSWPGNVRELEHLMERLTLTARTGTIDYVDLPTEILAPRSPGVCPPLGEQTFDEITDEFAKHVIRTALATSGGNKAKAAQLLQIPASTLRSKLEKYGLE